MVGLDRPPIRFTSHSIKEALRVWIKNPDALFTYIVDGLQSSTESQLTKILTHFGYDTWALGGYWQKIRENKELKDYVDAELQGINYGQMVVPELLYVIVRKLCPKVVVETGVASGVSSAYILQALHDNESGKLYSIDYPNYALNEAENVPTSGFAIPLWLRDRWELRIGKTCDLLSPLLKELNMIDMFIHDSEHSYENMRFEYLEAGRYLRKGGFILSHDINDNSAWKEYTDGVGREIFFTGLGIVKI